MTIPKPELEQEFEPYEIVPLAESEEKIAVEIIKQLKFYVKGKR